MDWLLILNDCNRNGTARLTKIVKSILRKYKNIQAYVVNMFDIIAEYFWPRI